MHLRSCYRLSAFVMMVSALKGCPPQWEVKPVLEDSDVRETSSAMMFECVRSHPQPCPAALDLLVCLHCLVCGPSFNAVGGRVTSEWWCLSSWWWLHRACEAFIC